MDEAVCIGAKDDCGGACGALVVLEVAVAGTTIRLVYGVTSAAAIDAAVAADFSSVAFPVVLRRLACTSRRAREKRRDRS